MDTGARVGLRTAEFDETLRNLWGNGWIVPVPLELANLSLEERASRVSGAPPGVALAVDPRRITQALQAIFDLMGRDWSPMYAGREVLEWFRKRSCSLPDVVALPANASGGYWKQDEPWKFQIPPSGLLQFSFEQVREAWRTAIQGWLEHIDGSVEFVSERPNMLAAYVRIDGPYSIMAKMQLAYPGIPADATLQGWVDTSGPYASLDSLIDCLAHELGHWLGLGHGRGLMSPTLQGFVRPQSTDVSRVLALGYRRRSRPVPPPTTPTDPPPTNPTPGVPTSPAGRRLASWASDAGKKLSIWESDS